MENTSDATGENAVDLSFLLLFKGISVIRAEPLSCFLGGLGPKDLTHIVFEAQKTSLKNHVA